MMLVDPNFDDLISVYGIVMAQILPEGLQYFFILRIGEPNQNSDRYGFISLLAKKCVLFVENLQHPLVRTR